MRSSNIKLFIALIVASIFAMTGCERETNQFKPAKPVARKPAKPEKSVAEIAAESLAEVVNSQGNDFAPIISADGNMLYFTSDQPGGKGGQDIWLSKREGSQWTKAENFTALNTDKDEGLDTFSQDGKAVYFTASDRPDGLGGNDIYVSHLTESGWSDPENLAAPINTKYNDANASLSADGKKLYFVSDRPGGEGSYDIWVSALGADGKWGNPKNLGDELNTDKWEATVFIAPDGQTLYFSSNGHGGFGGADIFRSIFRDGKWSKVENLGNSINTTDNETYFTLPGSGDLAYMSSSAMKGKGGADIVAVPMPMLFTPKKIVVLTGSVSDGQTGRPITAYIKVKYSPTRRDIAMTSTKEDGKFKVIFDTLDECTLMVYTDDKNIYPYYKPLKIEPDKDSQFLTYDIVKNEESKLIEKATSGSTPFLTP